MPDSRRDAWAAWAAVVSMVVGGVVMLFGDNLVGLRDEYLGGDRDASAESTSTSSSTTTAAPSTEVLVYDPPLLEDAHVISGACSAGSNATSRVDAFRCSVDDGLVDPCFSPGQDSSTPVDMVVCPWERPDRSLLDDPVVIALDNPLPGTEDDQRPNTDRPPWLVELANGAECRAATGMGAFIGQERINWVCDDGLLLIGEIDRSEDRWRVFGKLESDPAAGIREIQRAYF